MQKQILLTQNLLVESLDNSKEFKSDKVEQLISELEKTSFDNFEQVGTPFLPKIDELFNNNR